jgi:RNA polymerase sigma-70 factor (ECF subfamily)
VNDDAPLIDATLAGQTAAFGELVSRYQDRLYNTIVHVTGSAEDAQDVCQEAFVQAFVKLETFQRSSAFFTWLYRIAFNAAISQRRRRKPTVSVDEVRESTGGEPQDNGRAPGDRLDEQERALQVHKALGTLSEEYRCVLVLREMEGFDYETISEMLDLPIGTVRSRLHRARMQLREELKPVWTDERIAP